LGYFCSSSSSSTRLAFSFSLSLFLSWDAESSRPVASRVIPLGKSRIIYSRSGPSSPALIPAPTQLPIRSHPVPAPDRNTHTIECVCRDLIKARRNGSWWLGAGPLLAHWLGSPRPLYDGQLNMEKLGQSEVTKNKRDEELVVPYYTALDLVCV
jgi:hypothetical protein